MDSFHFNVQCVGVANGKKKYKCRINLVSDEGEKGEANITISEVDLNKITNSILAIISKTD
jgi:hypothetical protein